MSFGWLVQLLRNRPYTLWLDDTDVEEQAVVLEAGVAAVAAHEDVGVHEDVIVIEWTFLACHRSEYQVWELFLLLLGQYVHPAGCPHAHEVIYKLTACQSVLLQEQLDHALALLFNQFLFLAHIFNYLMISVCKSNK